MNIDFEKLKEIAFKKRFSARGVPFAKKMWRDGYNKALDDFLIAVDIFLEEKGNGK